MIRAIFVALVVNVLRRNRCDVCRGKGRVHGWDRLDATWKCGRCDGWGFR